MRRSWVVPHSRIPLSRPCALAGVARATVYAQRKMEKPSAEEVELMNRIDAQYTATPFYGSRRMTAHLRAPGVVINRKRIQRLMRRMGLAGMAPGPHTSKPHPEHQVYP